MAESNGITLWIRSLKGTLMMLIVSIDDTILSIKTEIAKQQNVAIEQQRLFLCTEYKYRLLADGNTINSYQLRNQSMIHLFPNTEVNSVRRLISTHDLCETLNAIFHRSSPPTPDKIEDIFRYLKRKTLRNLRCRQIMVDIRNGKVSNEKCDSSDCSNDDDVLENPRITVPVTLPFVFGDMDLYSKRRIVRVLNEFNTKTPVQFVPRQLKDSPCIHLEQNENRYCRYMQHSSRINPRTRLAEDWISFYEQWGDEDETQQNNENEKMVHGMMSLFGFETQYVSTVSNKMKTITNVYQQDTINLKQLVDSLILEHCIEIVSHLSTGNLKQIKPKLLSKQLRFGLTNLKEMESISTDSRSFLCSSGLPVYLCSLFKSRNINTLQIDSRFNSELRSKLEDAVRLNKERLEFWRNYCFISVIQMYIIKCIEYNQTQYVLSGLFDIEQFKNKYMWRNILRQLAASRSVDETKKLEIKIPDDMMPPPPKQYDLPKDGSAIDIKLWNDHANNTNLVSWKHSVVPYLINGSVTNGLKTLIHEAINQFNTKTPVKWIQAQHYNKNYVVFGQKNSECCFSEYIGKKQGTGSQFISLPYPNYPNSEYKTRVVCVMHEMMHSLGFHHEQARQDAHYHCKSNTHQSYSHLTVPFGSYDYRSIMHYRDGWGFEARNRELAALADESDTFSQGDLAGLRRFYGQDIITMNADDDSKDDSLQLKEGVAVEVYNTCKTEDRCTKGIFLSHYINNQCLVKVKQRTYNVNIKYVRRIKRSRMGVESGDKLRRKHIDVDVYDKQTNKWIKGTVHQCLVKIGNDQTLRVDIQNIRSKNVNIIGNNEESKQNESGSYDKPKTNAIEQSKPKVMHFGEWHRECNGKECTATTCSCNACGKLPGGVNCGYVGDKGHWTCCFDEDRYNKYCRTTHTGFWHMKCIGSKCTKRKCVCGSCSGGCTYRGNLAHWSCCNEENFDSKCKQIVMVNNMSKPKATHSKQKK
eukprot:233735_1